MKVSNRIKEIRKQQGMSGIKLAEILKISAPYLYDLEKGKRSLSTEMAVKIAEIFKVTTDYLLCNTDSSSFLIENKERTIDSIKESMAWYEIPIEDLAKHELSYKGHKLSEEQKKNFAKIIQAAADMLKQ